ncbi:transglutaminaseTgpA domain-containing protein [Motiliproteus sp.]|uniref:transglutaminaseTgpA domain-containing protein n=1 Tax=Motiliproteus sp. TaxID=1898955 RepID=UPI003BA845E4
MSIMSLLSGRGRTNSQPQQASGIADPRLDWLIALYLLVALIPTLLPLSLILQGLVLLPFVARAWVNPQPRTRSLLVLSVIVAWAAQIQLGAQPWLSGQTFLSGLLIAVALKWAESSSPHEFRFLATLSLVLFALSSLQFNGLVGLSYLLLGVFCFVLVQLLIDEPNGLSVLLARLGTATRLLLLALPIAVVLFVTVPRIQGPLWDLGIVMGLPIELVIDQDQREQGFKASLQAGKVSRLKTSDSPILVAEFEGTVPYKSRLYWRGPVYDLYDGISWQMRSDWDNRTRLLKGSFRNRNQLDSVIASKSDRVSYEARITANGGRWMYGLDFPYGSSPETFISNEFQVLGIRKLTREFNYQQQAYLEYSGGRALTQEERRRYLQLPQNANPRLQQWGGELALAESDPARRIYDLQVHLAEGDYQLTQTPDIEEYPDSLDEFFFDRKEGGIEHLAGATALVLRAAGIPTRLVSGYRGGSLIALTNFVVVRQAHAHVWVEAWDDLKGWQRFEAKDFVEPPAKQQPKPAAKAAKSEPAKQKAAKDPVAKAPEPVATPTGQSKPSTASSPATGMDWLVSLSSGLETWILNYNPDRQVELMKKSGLRTVDWKSLLATSLLSLLLLMLIYGLLLGRRKAKQDPLERLFGQLNRAMAKQGLDCGPQECPQRWLQRLEVEAQNLYPALELVISAYIRLRYSRASVEPGQIKELQRDIKRLAGML